MWSKSRVSSSRVLLFPFRKASLLMEVNLEILTMAALGIDTIAFDPPLAA